MFQCFVGFKQHLWLMLLMLLLPLLQQLLNIHVYVVAAAHIMLAATCCSRPNRHLTPAQPAAAAAAVAPTAALALPIQAGHWTMHCLSALD
jgi:hypothetical protein